MISLLDALARIEAGAATAGTIIDECAAAIAAREESVGAFVRHDIAHARAQARSAVDKPLRGIPVGVKDIIDTFDMPTEYGSPVYAGHQPRADAALVAMTRRAGAVVLGKTVTTEFAYFTPGRTRNPHNLEHTPGGSSSGSAAAVAAGMLPLAFGTQTGGSVIRPAAFCGVAGYKPSAKLLPTVGIKCFSWSLDTAGLFAATVADAACAAAAITGRDLRIDNAAPVTPSIAVVRTHLWNEADADMQRALEQAARAAERAGARVRDLDTPQTFAEAFAAQDIIQSYEVNQALAFEYYNHRDRLSAPLLALLERARSVSSDDYDNARRAARRARSAFTDTLGDADVILTPSAPGIAPHGLASTGRPIFNRLWTLLGNPCVNVPGLSDKAGMPLGVQIVGRFGRDRATLEAAAFLERALRR